MTTVQWLPLAVISASLVPGLMNFFLGEERHGTRVALNIAAAVLKLTLVVVMLAGVSSGEIYEVRVRLLPTADLVLHADALSLLFVTLSASLWLLTTLYAVAYLDGSSHRSRFFGFFSLCVSATAGIALAGNLLTLLLFYEALTLATYPLVVHRGTQEALAAGRLYLAYTLSGGMVLLIAVAWLRSLVGPLDFVPGGLLREHYVDATKLVVIFALLVIGFGVKAALVPLHGWLPRAMVAPAPVSALLHAVAVVKAGVFGIVRVVYDVYGIDLAQSLGVLGPLAVFASVTIVWGSVRALQQDELKKRLAFSTVSQVAYIALGTAVLGPIATIGGLVHLVHQGLMKITLFFCAGNLAETLGIHHVSEMRGVGRRMPLTMTAFTVAAFGMIGIPPIAGFISKWYLGLGAVSVGAHWVLGVLMISTVLNAAYFLPTVYAAWFQEPEDPWPRESVSTRTIETRWMLLLPPLVTGAAALAAGLLAGGSLSPLAWAQFIVAQEYRP